MIPKVLKLAPSGIPIGWMSLSDAAVKIFKDDSFDSKTKAISWMMGENAFQLKGGFNSLTGERSVIDIPAIVAVNESGKAGHNNLFQGFSADICKFREGMHCAYCLKQFTRGSLTIDHIFPKSRGGLFTMENSIASCVLCNNKKADRTPEEAKMPLLLKPFVPTMGEVMYMLRMGNMLDIQRDYLRDQFKNQHQRDYLMEAFTESPSVDYLEMVG